jgi:hypothetical protein
MARIPGGSDPDDPFIDIIWWVNQELLHHGARFRCDQAAAPS